MGSLWAAGFLLRRLRDEVGVVALLVALVGITSFLFAGAPRLFNLVADGALVHELAGAPAVDRDLQLSSVSSTPPGQDPLAAVDQVGEAYQAAFPDSIRQLIWTHRYSATTPRFGIANPLRLPTFVSLRSQDGLESAIQLVEGRMPASTGDQLPRASFQFGEPQPEPQAERARIEIAVSERTAARIGLHVGDVLGATLDGSDPTVRGVLLRRIEAEFDVVGIFSVIDPEAEVWFADRSLQRPDIGGTDEFPIAYATGLVAREAYPDITTTELPFNFAWRFLVAPERVDVAQLATVVPDLRRIQSLSADETFGSRIEGSLLLRTGLLGIIGRYVTERSSTEAVMAVAAIGPFALATGAIAMVAIMLIARRRTSLELARSRGASTLLLLAAQLWEAALLAGGASLLGLLLAVQLVPGRASSLSATLALATGGAAAIALVAATLPTVRRRLGRDGRDDAAVLPPSPRRLVLELTGVGLAVAGVLLLRQRGLVIGDRGVGEVVRLDPFLAAVPVLAGLATGIVAMRLYPLPIRAFGWLAARRRDLVPVLGLRNVGRHAAAANLPLLILMLTAAFGAFASVLLSSIDRGQVDAAWTQVGADYRIELAEGLDAASIDPTTVAGVDAVAAGFADQSASFADSPSQRSQVVLQAVDPDAYLAVTAGTSIAVSWPADFTELGAPAELAGTPEAPIPALVSRLLPSGSGPLARGDTFTVEVTSRTLTFVVVDRVATFPGIRPDAAFVVTSLNLLREANLDPTFSPTVLFVRGAGNIGPQLATLVADHSPSSTVTSRYDRYALLRQAPFVAMVTGGFRIAVIAVVVYAALAIIAALALTAARRSQDLAFLRTLGLSQRQSLGLTVIEHGPPVLLALVPGVALGIWIAILLAAGLGLEAFIGPNTVFTIQVAWGEIALVGLALIGLVTIAAAASTWLARRGQAVDALRLGGE